MRGLNEQKEKMRAIDTLSDTQTHFEIIGDDRERVREREEQEPEVKGEEERKIVSLSQEDVLARSMRCLDSVLNNLAKRKIPATIPL